MPEYLGVEEAAKELGIRPHKLRRLIRSGIITPGKRIGHVWLLTRGEVNRVKRKGLGTDLRYKGPASLDDIKK
jgi:hypothetical protein